MRYEEPYEIFTDGLGGYTLFNREKGDIVSLDRVRFMVEEGEYFISIRSEGNPFFVSDKPAVPSKAKATEFFRLFSGHCDKVDPTFVRKWHKKFDTVARINPVKLTESAFPLSMMEMEEEFRTIAMGLEA